MGLSTQESSQGELSTRESIPRGEKQRDLSPQESSRGRAKQGESSNQGLCGEVKSRGGNSGEVEYQGFEYQDPHPRESITQETGNYR